MHLYICQWRILLGKRKLEELQDKDGNSILLTFDKYKDAFKKALNECRDRVTVVLLLRCLAKCCECESLRQPLIDMFTILDASSSSMVHHSYFHVALDSAHHDHDLAQHLQLYRGLCNKYNKLYDYFIIGGFLLEAFCPGGLSGPKNV
jgi:hypothetical protein